MGELVNLRRVKKARARAEQSREAEANRVKFGQTKAEKTARAAEQARHARQLDQSKIERDTP